MEDELSCHRAAAARGQLSAEELGLRLEPAKYDGPGGPPAGTEGADEDAPGLEEDERLDEEGVADEEVAE